MQQVFDPVQVFGGTFQFLDRLPLADFVFGNPRRLLEHLEARVFFVVQDVVHHAEGDDGVGIGTNARVQKQGGDVAQAAKRAVEAVFAFAGSVQGARDGDGLVFGGQQVFGVVERDGHLRHAALLALFGAVKDHARHLVEAQFFAFLLAQHPADGVHDIRFARAIRPDDPDDILIEVDGRFGGKTFEAFQFQSL